MNSEYKIEVKNVSKVFKMYNTPMDKLKEALSFTGKSRHTDFYAITDLSFEVKKGEILGIMGRNGAGKSTLLKMITGIYDPTYGEINISGNVSSLLELGTGFNIEYTGLENIFLYGSLMGRTRKQMEDRFQDIITFAEIGDYIYQPVKTYSSGMFARLAFACAINVEPDILIVDEILSVGDMRFQAKCFNKFKEFRERGVTILYVGHDVGMMRTFCDRAMWINKGRLVDIGDPTYISAKFTEFMYLDDISQFTDYKRVEDKPKKEVLDQESDKEASIKTTEDVKECKSVEEPKKESSKIRGSLFPDSLAHWGMRPGLVSKIKVLNSASKEINYFNAYEKITIEIYFDIPTDIDTETVSIAFSIKNKEGTDIIVKTTYDEDIEINVGKGQKIAFQLEPWLANGDYYLVIAIENRENTAITYYEYIEGAFFFKMYTDKKIFGVFDPPITIDY